MAEIITRVDDLDRSPDARLVRVGVEYIDSEETHHKRDVVIDLSERNLNELTGFLEKYFTAGRPFQEKKTQQAGSAGVRRGRRKTVVKESTKIRAWARMNGYEITESGRIPKRIEEAYYKAHNNEAKENKIDEQDGPQGAVGPTDPVPSPQFTSA